MSQVKEIGEKLVAFCKAGENMKCIDDLYAEDIVSVEAMQGPGGPREQKGIAAIRQKNEWWSANHEVLRGDVEGPFPHGDDKFAVIFDYDIKRKTDGEQLKMREIALFHVANGKIAREEFFYG